MASTTLAYKSSLRISSLSRSVASVGKVFESAAQTTSTIASTLSSQNEIKRKGISDRSKYFLARREAVRRREQESIIEASSIGGAIKRTGKVVAESTKGFLGRILDFVGTLLVGWLLLNLPRIIDGAKKLIERVQKLVMTLTSAVGNITDFLFSFGQLLGGVLRDVATFNFGNIGNTIGDGMNKMNDSLRRFENDVFQGINLLANPIDFGLDEVIDDAVTKDTSGPATAEGMQPGSFSAGTYNAKRLTQLARAAGIPDNKIPTMVAIALAESGGRTNAHNPKPPDNSYGLWQINMIGKLGPERRKQFGISSDEELKDPMTNAKAALMVLNSQGFGAWSVYTSGAYKKYISSAQKAFESVKSAKTAPVKLGTSLSKGQNISGMIATKGVGYAEVTSLYGMRGGRMHKGIDIAAPRGTYIALRVDCEVMGTAFDSGGYGNVIDVWVPQYGVQLRFGHCDKIIQGSGYIPAGKSFATVGSTGRSDGPHIHFEYTKSKNSRTKSDGDPSPYVPLILLTSGTSSAGDFVSSAKASAAQISVTNNKQVAQRITTERQGEEVVVIRNKSAGEPTSPASVITTGMSMIPGGRELNTFIKDVLFLNLANS